MPQLNIHLTTDFQDNLNEYMRLRRLKTKSEAVRLAIAEALERERSQRLPIDFSAWLGMARRAPLNSSPRFPSDDALWE